MITENPNSEPLENNVNKEENAVNQPVNTDVTPEAEVTETETNEPETEVEAKVAETEVPKNVENEAVEVSETVENVVAEEVSHEDEAHEEVEHHENQKMTSGELMNKLEALINAEDAGANHKKFNAVKELLLQKITLETEDKKETDANFEHPLFSKVSALSNIFKEKYDDFHKKQDSEQKENLEKRNQIVEKLKNLYTNTKPGTNLFRAIREIKEEWTNAGQVPKSDFKNLNNNYFFHLNQFYQMLDLNKEYREQEYAHNLEKRNHIIARAKELQNEPVVQKALNELQFLHRLWKEEAEPVAEEFRDKTWDEFKEISNKIHERKSELLAEIEGEQQANLDKKNEIIETIKKLTSPEKAPNHNYWQQAIKKVEDARAEFLKLGSVPRKISNQNWNDFKQALRTFNNNKNEFYKGLKNSQHTNLEEKMKLIQTAQDNMNSEDWETVVPLFKKLQEDWKKIGHVPRSHTNKVWDDFREACNTFFNNYRAKNNAQNDDWKENYKQKRALLDELKELGDEEGSVEKIEHIKTSWNNIGKVPRDKMAINTEFNKTLREKLKLNRINEYDLKEEGLSESQLTDKARKIKNQIADLEAEIVKLENNLGFFGKVSRDNPLLKDTFNKIDEKKQQLESLKHSLHNIITGE